MVKSKKLPKYVNNVYESVTKSGRKCDVTHIH